MFNSYSVNCYPKTPGCELTGGLGELKPPAKFFTPTIFTSSAPGVV